MLKRLSILSARTAVELRKKKGGDLADPENQQRGGVESPLVDVRADARCMRLALQALRFALCALRFALLHSLRHNLLTTQPDSCPTYKHGRYMRKI